MFRWIAATFALLVIAALGAAWLLLGRVELASFAAARASAALGREVRIGSLHVIPGRWISLDAKDVTLANLPDGTEPIMARLPEARAEVQAWSLVFGPPVVRNLSLGGLRMLMEHDPQGQANWHFGATPGGGHDRAGVATLLAASLADGEVRLRTSKGKMLDIKLDRAGLQAADPATPASLTAGGSYNGVPLELEAALGSFDALRDATRPFPIDLRAHSGELRLRFQGGMTDPLAVDGAEGGLTLEGPSAPLLGIAGIESRFQPAFRLIGRLSRQDRLWELTQGSGTLGDAPITAAHLRLQEGQHGVADQLDIGLSFDALDLDTLLGPHRPGDPGDTDLPLTVDPSPDVLLTVKLSARQFAYAGLRADEARLEASKMPGKVELQDLSLTYQGGQIHAKGLAQAREGAGGGLITGTLEATGLDVQVLRRGLGIRNLPLQGKMDGQFAIQGEGETLNAATRGAHTSAVVVMTGGSIARRLVEHASIDLRSLLRSADGNTAVRCLVGVLDMEGAAGTISPLRIRTASGTIAGNGRFDLNRHSIDLLVSSESETTSSYALDVPVRLSGSMDDPSVEPARWSASGRALLAAGDDVSRLLPALQPFALRSACLSRSARRGQ